MSQPFQRRLDFSDVTLYAVTPSVKEPQKLTATVDALLAGGIDALQLRGKELPDRDLLALGRILKEKCAKAGVLFIINNRPDIALALDADGVHIGHEDLPIAFVRGLIGHRKIIGVSTHSVPEAIDAQKNGADYVSCGPLWETPTKPTYRPVGVGLVGLYNAALRIPFIAIGSIDEKKVDSVAAAGAKRIALVRALFDAKDPKAAAQFYKEKFSKNLSAANAGK